MKLVAILVASVALTGCVVHPPLNTPSGRPQTFIAGATPAEVSAEIVSVGMARNTGYYLEEATERRVVFVNDNPGMGAAMLFGSGYNAMPQARIEFTIVPVNSGSNVYANMFMVTNPGSGFARRTDLTTGKDAHKAQAMLERLKRDIEARKALATNPAADQPPASLSE